ncbi:RNA polymerase sigma factor [Flectobacillus longus]|uniref:RNA polymerase sigma factor n=1 Tax=Flectobacillus longus TaxID=2984207 RepID=UPI0024B6CE6D|nr:RNA polymerase sigma factor [Flectobacillus longus]MDI9882194.1 RNA polymerase sigma factor [Flectobacillus longus]
MSVVKQHIINEVTLWDSIKNGNHQSFSVFYDTHIQALDRYAQRMTKDNQLIADAIQDVFLEVWKNRQTLNQPTSWRYYLLAMVRNRIIKLAKNETGVYTNEGWENYEDDTETPEELLIISELLESQKNRLQLYFEQLPNNQQQVLTLRFFEELSYPEIADFLQIREQSVRNLIQRAIQKLRELMRVF